MIVIPLPLRDIYSYDPSQTLERDFYDYKGGCIRIVYKKETSESIELIIEKYAVDYSLISSEFINVCILCFHTEDEKNNCIKELKRIQHHMKFFLRSQDIKNVFLTISSIEF
jgi:hypothetical protein